MTVVNADLHLQGRKASEKLFFRTSDLLTLARFQTFLASQKCMVLMLGKSILR
jgi:hypothetical protein